MRVGVIDEAPPVPPTDAELAEDLPDPERELLDGPVRA